MKLSWQVELQITTALVEFEDEPYISEVYPQAPKGLREAAHRRYTQGDPLSRIDRLVGRVEATFDKENR